MKSTRTFTLIVVSTIMTVSILGLASFSFAFQSQTSACGGCHSTSGVLTLTSNATGSVDATIGVPFALVCDSDGYSGSDNQYVISLQYGWADNDEFTFTASVVQDGSTADTNANQNEISTTFQFTPDSAGSFTIHIWAAATGMVGTLLSVSVDVSGADTTIPATSPTTSQTAPVGPGLEISPYLIIGFIGVIILVGLILGQRRRKPSDEPLPIIEDKIEPPPPAVVEVLRGGEIVGGKYVYKVKVNNGTQYVINNVIVTLTAYPEDCMILEDETTKTIKRIEPGGFRSPSFSFRPTEDCVKGNIRATVSYIDHMDESQIMKVEPHEIKSVCDLLNPLASTIEEFDLILGEMEVIAKDQIMDWNPEVIFKKTNVHLTSCNFHIMDSKSSEEDGKFRGEVRGLAVGKHTDKKVAVRVVITGSIDKNDAYVEMEVLGDDMAMLPVALGEITKGLDTWICLNCGEAFEPDEADALQTNLSAPCRFCRQTMNLDMYRK